MEPGTPRNGSETSLVTLAVNAKLVLKESCRLGWCRENGIIETGGVMDKCLQMLDKVLWRLGNRIRRAERDFGGLPKRRDAGRVVDPPLVFKRGFLSGYGIKKDLPWIERT
ncbi:hypothetical protein TNCV_1753621 [Trichonephila clavipes]|nr:hypothetical protein TNCV_1753621 [Trichonephila clavipes]